MNYSSIGSESLDSVSIIDSTGFTVDVSTGVSISGVSVIVSTAGVSIVVSTLGSVFLAVAFLVVCFGGLFLCPLQGRQHLLHLEQRLLLLQDDEDYLPF